MYSPETMYYCHLRRTYGIDNRVLVIDLSRPEEVVEIMARANSKYDTADRFNSKDRMRVALAALERAAKKGRK